MTVATDRETLLLRGTLDMCVLSLLASRPTHASGVVRRLQESGFGLAQAVGYGHVTHYSTDVSTVFIEIILVALGCAAAIAIGHRHVEASADLLQWSRTRGWSAEPAWRHDGAMPWKDRGHGGCGGTGS